MMATKKRKHTRKILNKNIFDEIVNDEIKEMPIEFNPEEQKQEEPLDLNAVIEFYHKKLYENQEALEYLDKLGLKKQENYERFKIGYADSSILNSLSKKQKVLLKKLNIIGEDDKEYFINCIIFPIFNCDEKVSSIYGFDILKNEFLKPVYLSEKIPIFNHKATKVYDEVILTENIIEALSLIEMDIENVITINDSKDITENHIRILKNNRVKTIALGLKDDLTRDSIKDLFIKQGFNIRVISPPNPHSSWNDVLQNNVERNQITKTLIEAETFTPEKPKGLFQVKKDSSIYTFITDEITYHLAGIKDIFSPNLKAKMKAETGENHHRDNIDLYSFRARQNFAGITAGKLNVNSVKVEKDLDKILDYFEDQRDKKTNIEKEKIELTEEEKELGLKFLNNPDICQEIINDVTALGYVGEDLNKLLLYLCATSRLTDNPVSVLIISQSATGKSFIVDNIKKLIPKDEVITIHSLSDQALNYIKDLMGKFLAFGEAVFNPEVERQIREMLSSKELSRMVVDKDDKTGELIGKIISKDVNVACVMSTTSNNVHPENASRFFIINADESVEQTKRIYEAQKDKYSTEREQARINIIPEIIKKHHACQKLLKKQTIIIPENMRDNIRFPYKLMRLRRDHERFIDLMAVVCFLRQYQKKIINNSELSYIECDCIDYKVAYEILVKGALKSTIHELPQQAVILYEEIRKMVKDIAEIENIRCEEAVFTQREIREYTGFSQMYVKRYIKILSEYEYIKVKQGGGSRGSRHNYSIIADEVLSGIDVSMIPAPEEMEEILKS